MLSGDWPFGNLVSTYVHTAPDDWARTIMLVLPEINLLTELNMAFSTFAVLTTHVSSEGGPQFVEGQLQDYSSSRLRASPAW